MELLDGYIVGIFNYCDRWCERCPLTSRCRVFTSTVEMEASDDPLFVTLGAGLLRTAGALDSSLTPSPLTSIEDEQDEDEPVEEWAPPSRLHGGLSDHLAVPAEHDALEARATEYADRITRWMVTTWRDAPPTADAVDVITWFQFMLGAKINRALDGIRDVAAGDLESLPDASGSARVALLGAERSLGAWRELVVQGVVTAAEAEPFEADLAFMVTQLETLIPTARTFVRPGFDEPDDVARLIATGG